MPRRSAQYDRLVRIEEMTETRGDAGQPVQTWALKWKIHVRRESQAATERFVAQQRFAETDTLFRCGWSENITPKINPRLHRLVYRGRVFDILGVEEVGRREEALIPTKARTDGGGQP